MSRSPDEMFVTEDGVLGQLWHGNLEADDVGDLPHVFAPFNGIGLASIADESLPEPLAIIMFRLNDENYPTGYVGPEKAIKSLRDACDMFLARMAAIREEEAANANDVQS